MAIQFNVLPSNINRYVPPYTQISATDTTDALSGVSSWRWDFSNTTVSYTSSWIYTAFGSIAQAPLTLYVSGAFGTAQSSSTYIEIKPFVSVIDFEILPAERIEYRITTNSAAMTAIDTSPAVSGVSSWQWTFNGVPVSNINQWAYTFFDHITGTIQMSVQGSGFSGTEVVSKTLEIYSPEQNACGGDPVVPAGIRGSTNLSPVITSFGLLSERIKMQLGWPVVNIELCDDEIYDFINQACEWYSKYAGQTEEYFVFDSANYLCGRGLKIDTIINKLTDFYCGCNCPTTVNSAVTGQFFDCDVNNYRKVMDIFSLDPAGGNSYSGTGTEVLFNMDYLFAQQAYFGQMMGGMGYDLVTWHLLKGWLKDRARLFATQPYVRFDPRTQTLFITPEPGSRSGSTTYPNRYVAVIGCWLERSVAQLVQERWVQRYSMALTKIALANIRSKFGNLTLFGGASINASDLMTQGIAERDKLEEELMNGFGEATPIAFYRG